MRPKFDEFCEAYCVIMDYIDDKENSRPLFHKLLSFYLLESKRLKTLGDGFERWEEE